MIDPNELVKQFHERMSALKKSDPKKYQTALRELNVLLSDLDRDIEELEKKVL